MHDVTMDIKEFDSPEAAKKKGYKIPLSDKEAMMLQDMNRAERRKWARSKGYFPPEEHNAWVKLLNARKASRKRQKAATLKMQRRARSMARA